ncbi:DUF3916 domain-containing protein [Bacillus safensis]|uniref:DUF3916 domain-containing protein n=1 Tax=Bacillus safensis TaxID=561879 RepID=UPI002074CCB3|nr:DUF3916 domain-containing protein [Bacillus safensis]USD83464.1 DUF3916 domain-containing protein [Bacillus safensis]
MREKKVRGRKRKTDQMVTRIEENTQKFPADFEHGYWHLPLPVAYDFISSSKTPTKIKRLCIQTLLNRAEHLIDIKPNDGETYRVVVAVDVQGFWGSQIILFKGDAYFQNFFDRHDDNQKWLPLPAGRDFQREWGLSVSKHMQTVGFKEIISSEDGISYEGERWFMGELK